VTKVWQKSIDRYWTYCGNIKFSGAFGHAVTLTFDLLTPKCNQFICVPRCTSDKSFAKIRQQILEISRKQKFGMYSVMLWPWPLTFWTQNLISSSLSRDEPVTKVWWKSVNRYWRYRRNIKLPRESQTDGGMHGRTHEQRNGRTTRKHIASAAAYRWWRLKNSPININRFVHGEYFSRTTATTIPKSLTQSNLTCSNSGKPEYDRRVPVTTLTRWPQRKKIPSFPGFSRAIKLLFHRLRQQKVNARMTFIKGHSTSTPAI